MRNSLLLLFLLTTICASAMPSARASTPLQAYVDFPPASCLTDALARKERTTLFFAMSCAISWACTQAHRDDIDAHKECLLAAHGEMIDLKDSEEVMAQGLTEEGQPFDELIASYGAEPVLAARCASALLDSRLLAKEGAIALPAGAGEDAALFCNDAAVAPLYLAEVRRRMELDFRETAQ